MLMANRVLLRKLLFLHHVATLPLNTLARQVYEWEKSQDHVSLTNELQPVLVEFGIGDFELYSKKEFKRKVKRMLFMKNKMDILKMAQGYKKIDIDKLSTHSFKMCEYFQSLDIHLARLQFKLNSFMTPKVASNFHRDPCYRTIKYM